MPLITRSEFSDLCGDRRDALTTYISRGKVVLSPQDKKVLDTDDPINASFIAERQRFNSEKNTIKQEKPVEKPAKVANSGKVERRGRPRKGQEKQIEPAEIQKKEHRLAEQAAISKLRLDQDMQKKALEIENLELAKQQKMLQLNKAAGELIPVDLMKGVLKRHADSINKSFEKGIETLIAILAQQINIDKPTYSRFVGQSKQLLSDCILKAGKSANEEVSILVDEFSQTLNRGQRRS